MKGNEKLRKKLNELPADELTAMSQLMVHSEMHNRGAPGAAQTDRNTGN